MTREVDECGEDLPLSSLEQPIAHAWNAWHFSSS